MPPEALATRNDLAYGPQEALTGSLGPTRSVRDQRGTAVQTTIRNPADRTMNFKLVIYYTYPFQISGGGQAMVALGLNTVYPAGAAMASAQAVVAGPPHSQLTVEVPVVDDSAHLATFGLGSNVVWLIWRPDLHHGRYDRDGEART